MWFTGVPACCIAECESLSKSSTVIESGSEATEDPPCKQPSSVEPRCNWLLEVWLLLCRQVCKDA